MHSIRQIFTLALRTLQRATKTPVQRSDEAAAKVLAPGGETFKESEYITRRRQEVIAEMGKNWIMHPEYRPIPRHSNHVHVWWPHRTLKGTAAV